MSTVIKCDNCQTEFKVEPATIFGSPQLYHISAPELSGAICPERSELDFCSLDCIKQWAELKIKSYEVNLQQNEKVGDALNAIKTKVGSDVSSNS